jgi:hypothetical protein
MKGCAINIPSREWAQLFRKTGVICQNGVAKPLSAKKIAEIHPDSP